MADFHIHSTFSDGKLSIPEIVDFFGMRDFGAIAITDHLCEESSLLGKSSAYLGCTLTRATFPLYREIIKSEADRAWREYRMRVIPGIEITKNSILNHRSAHVLALGVNEYISADGDVTEIIANIHAAGGIAVAAHPVWTRRIEKQTFHLWDRRQELASMMDAWEVASGPHLFPEVEGSGLPVLANGDFHHPKHLTSWKTSFECERHPEAILKAICEQDLGIHFYQENLVYENRSLLGAHLLQRRMASLPIGNLGLVQAF